MSSNIWSILLSPLAVPIIAGVAVATAAAATCQVGGDAAAELLSF